MISISRTNAENRFAAIEKTRQKALGEQEEIALKIRKKTAHLKSLRFAKEAADLRDTTTNKNGTKKRAAKRIGS